MTNAFTQADQNYAMKLIDADAPGETEAQHSSLLAGFLLAENVSASD